MNARYYDSSSGRFISQDSYKGTLTEPQTQHLYSYTSNNPINFIDPTGHKQMNLGGNNISTLLYSIRKLKESIKNGKNGLPKGYNNKFNRFTSPNKNIIKIDNYFGYIEKAANAIVNTAKSITNAAKTVVNEVNNAINAIKDANEAMKNMVKKVEKYVFNDDEDLVLSGSNKFYKGAPVIRVDLSGWPSYNRSFCAGPAIILDKKENDKDVVKHEYGHFWQYLLIGPGNYYTKIGAPSAMSKKSGMDYYSQPWEISADWFGGAKRKVPYNPGAKLKGFIYFVPMIIFK